LTIIFNKIPQNSPFIGYSDMSGVFICGSLFDLPGGEAPTGILFNIPTLSLYKKSRKEMASLGENGQEYKCPFFKSAREILQKTSLKNTMSA
jgi:hypothetical protein